MYNNKLTKFVCCSCNKEFNTNSHLKQHMSKKNPCFNELKTDFDTINNNNVTQDVSLQNIINSYNTISITLKKNIVTINELKNNNIRLKEENKYLKLKISAIQQIIHTNSDIVSNVSNAVIPQKCDDNDILQYV